MESTSASYDSGVGVASRHDFASRFPSVLSGRLQSYKFMRVLPRSCLYRTLSSNFIRRDVCSYNVRFMATATNNLKYLLILDFEATCGDATNGQHEIIEFPTLVYDLETDEVKATFHEYVRPEVHPTLTEFCTNLTGITQVCPYSVLGDWSTLLIVPSCLYRTSLTQRNRFQTFGRATTSSSKRMS